MSEAANQHNELESQIAELKAFSAVLKEEVIITPLIDVVSRIINLPEDVSSLDDIMIHYIQGEVEDCKRILDDFGYSYIRRAITHPEPSRVFKILTQADRFAKELRKMVGKKVTMEDGEEVVMTEAVCNALTKFRFSIGTPPITPKGIDTIERILFGGNLHSIYQFRELLGGGNSVKYLFDGFVANVEKLVTQSTHYTTADEKRQFERRARDFNNFEGLRGLTKSVVTGTAKTAIRLIKEELFSRHRDVSHPVKVLPEKDCLNDELIARMREEKETIFVVRVSKVPHHLLTSDKLEEKWHGILGRLILVDDSANSRRAGTTIVYSLFPDVVKTLDVIHVKDSGTPANTQMNLRSIIENFSPEGLSTLEARVVAKIKEYEEDGVQQLSAHDARKKEWHLSAQKDYLSLKNFLKFIGFIKRIQKADDAELAEITSGLVADNEGAAMNYFFKNLKGRGYELVAVPQGGGRKELGHVGQFLSAKFNSRLKIFQTEGALSRAKKRLGRLKARKNIRATQAENQALRRAQLIGRSPSAAIRDAESRGGDFIDLIREKLRTLSRNGVTEADRILREIEQAIEAGTAANISGRIRHEIARKLSALDLGSASKLMERGVPKKIGGLVRRALGLIRTSLGKGVEALQGTVDIAESMSEDQDLSLAERLLNDIENGSLKPNLALCEVGWTFEDVLSEDDFPATNYLKISMKEDGELDPDSLEQQLETAQRSLRDFPELFQLYCASIILIINDPHNPTSRVARNETKLKLLHLASKYRLTILSDDAYHKQVKKSIKDEQGDMTLAEFYELHRTRFANPITIYSTIPTTKWAMGAGRRSGIILSNDKDVVDGQNFTGFVRTNTDSVNTMSLFMDRESFKIGQTVKHICAKLEPTIIGSGDPVKVIDEILQTEFSNISAQEFLAPLYFTLIEARNDLDCLAIRAAHPLEIRRYISDFVADLKDFRLDKQTQRDSAQRSKVVDEAIERVTADYPFLAKGAIKPEGPFYVCVKLDNGPSDPSLMPFLETIARARNIAVVPTKKGYVRFAFGGELDGTDEGYEILGLAVETDLRILIDYWEKFKTERASLHEQAALKKLFPGGEIEQARTLRDKKTLVEKILSSKGRRRKQLVFDRPANVADYVRSIEPDSSANIVTLSEIRCQNLREFVQSRPFKDLFNYYLLKVKSKVPALRHLEDTDVIAFYGARQFAEKEETRIFKDAERAIFAHIAIEIAKLWFSDSTIKILASQEGGAGQKAFLGSERMLGDHIRSFLKVFLTAEEETALLQSFRDVPDAVKEYLSPEIAYPATIQAGYEVVTGVKPNQGLPQWSQSLIEKGEFAAHSTATDSSPVLSTPGKARVPGVDRAILRRDGDGKNAPKQEFFSNRLRKFTEIMNPKDYVLKMIQVGGTKVLLVMNRSYSHYMVEELRLFPQTDLTPADLTNCKPDAVSFLGLPTKVMGEDYRIGYYFDHDDQGNTIPVSWVDAESITDYMGYLKKPILTVANEKVREKEMMPIHGSAFSIVFKNGLRKTIVMAGDSGTGKSETIIAMMEQIITNQGLAAQVEGIEFLSGDMLSLFEGDDGQMYMLGTEQGDFMRMTDIPADWKKRVRDRIYRGSKTNLSDTKNPRITIGNLCDPVKFQKPVRVNCLFNINNFETPSGSCVSESESTRTLLLDEYVRGYRGEKGTSGDQPNLYASVLKSKRPDKDEIVREFGEDLDLLLGWDILTGESGKAENAYLSFNDVKGGVFKAKSMVDKLLKGKKIEGKEIVATRYACRENHYYATLRGTDGKEEEVIVDREGIFSKLYNPIASTYCGDPFVSPQKMAATLSRFADVMQKAGVITGTLFTQLKVDGMEFDGPAKASQDLLKFLLEDDRINARFQKHIRTVDVKLREKYGAEVLNSSTIPDEIMAHNLFLLERHESDNIRPIDSKGQTIHLRTPHYKYDPDAAKTPFNPSLITPEIETVINDVCTNTEHDKFNLRSFEFEISQYGHIQTWNSKEELIYQVLIKNGLAKVNYKETHIAQIPPKEVKKAEKIAEQIMAERAAA